MKQELSKFRLNMMRLLYVITFLGLGYSAWPEIIRPKELWDPVQGVAFSFWAAYSTLMLLGLRYPVRMLPLLLLQLLYKLIWLIGVAYPLWSADRLDPVASELIRIFSIAVIVDTIVIPWSYVLTNYVKGLFNIKPKQVANR